MRIISLGMVLVVVGLGCGRNPCSELARVVCGQAPDTPACDRASRTTNGDECMGFLQDVARFIELANEKVETPVRQPPSPPTPPGGPDAPSSAPAASQDSASEGGAPPEPGSTTSPATTAPSPGGDGSPQ